MNLLISIIADVVNQIAKSVQLATLVPSSLLVMCNLLFILPAMGMTVQENTIQISLVVLIIIATSSLLWLLNGVFIKLLEGYPYETTWWGRFKSKRLRERLKSLQCTLNVCETQLSRAQEWLEEILPGQSQSESDLQADREYKQIQQRQSDWLAIQSRCLGERDVHFPPKPGRILPTRLGNTISAFEYHPFLRYRINATLLWPHMVPILDKNGFASYVEREKSAFDFLLNLLVIIACLGLECAGLAALLLAPVWLVWTGLAVLLIFLGYEVLIINAVYWGDMVKVAYDLYRHDLREALLLPRPDSLEHEQELWEAVSKFLGTDPAYKPDMDYGLLDKRKPLKEETPWRAKSSSTSDSPC